MAEPAEAGDGFRKEIAGDKQLLVGHGKPLVFGKDRKRGLRMKPGTLDIKAVAISTAFCGAATLGPSKTSMPKRTPRCGVS